MTYFKYCRRLSYYKHGEYMEPPCSVHPIAEWCIFGIEVYSGTRQLSFLSPRGGKYIEIPRGVRYHHGVLSFGGTYMEVSFDAVALMETVKNDALREPDAVPRRVAGRSFQYMRSRLRACVARVPLEDVPLHEPPSGDRGLEGASRRRSRPRLPQLVHIDRDGKRRRMTAPIKAPARKENIYGGSS